MNRRFLASLMACAGLALIGIAAMGAAPPPATTRVFPPSAQPFGKSYKEWSAKFWQWALSLPVGGHPFLDTPSFDVTEGQDGPVWFLGSVLDGSQPLTVTHRTCTIPRGRALLVGTLNAEWSSLEGFPSETEQRAAAIDSGDHIVNLFFSIDGVPVSDLSTYRFLSPQFTFSAPTPWIFGPTGGVGTSMADGYYMLLKPLNVGHHVVHYGGGFHYSVAEGDPFDFDAALDMTYDLQVTAH
jgi:hypothetical protein